MRISLILLLIPLFHLSAETIYSQNTSLTLSFKNMSIEEVLDRIEQDTEFSFLFLDKLLDVDKKVSIQVNEESIEHVLDNLFTDTNIRYRVMDRQIVLMKKKSESDSIQQNPGRQITGTVTDERGDPIIGAHIMEKGTSNGVATDIDGKYHINVSPGAILTVSYIGFLAKEVPVKDQPVVNIILLEDQLRLDEVVVVGFGTARKSDLAGAVVRADLATLQESPNISLLSSLQGTVPGLNVGAVTEAGKDPEMSIRGRTSISGSNTPLVVLDGIIYRGNIVDINANDIESIDILKDASAAAIYGSEASNGVLLITTKGGKTLSKPIIEYSGSFSVQQMSNSKMKPLNREGFLNKIADRFLSESRIGDDMLQMNPDWDVSKYMGDNNALEGYMNGTDTNWWDMLTNDIPYIQSHNVSLRGRSEQHGYYFSMGYLDQQNLIINDTYQRYNIRVNMDMKVTDWLKMGMQSFFTMGDYSGVSPSISNVMNLPPVVPVRDEEGGLVKQPYKYYVNPLLETEQEDLNKRYTLSGVFFADVDFPFLKGLNYRINFSQNMINGKQYNFNPEGQNFTGSASKRNSSEYIWSVDNIMTYKKLFGKHSVNATFLYGAERRQYEATKASASVFNNTILGYDKLSAGQADLQKAESEAWEESSLYSMLRLMYTYNDRYMFTGTVRRDGFSGFGKDNKFGIFPSAAIAWRISEEDFFKQKINWVENLKLRMSYGVNGNRTVGRYQTLAKMGFTDGYLYGDGASAEQIQWLSSLSNSSLKWETTNTFNVGLEFSAFNGRLYGDMEYYTSQTKNVLFDINIPQINGLATIPSNIGKLKNRGFELSVSGVPVKTKDFSWDITFNFSTNRNKVVSILGIDADGDGKEDDLIANKIFIGKPYGVNYDYNIIGMWQIADKLNGDIPAGFEYGSYKVEDRNKDGNYTAADDRKILGYTDPLYRFSIQNTFRYRDWELKFFINSIQGGKDYYYGQPGSSLLNPDNIYQNNYFHFDYWTPENPNARYRQLGFYSPALGQSFSPYVQRNFVRLQDLTVSYNIPSKLLKKININRLKVYVTGKNLFTITDWDGWDPETGKGLTTGDYPLMKSYSVGLNIEF